MTQKLFLFVASFFISTLALASTSVNDEMGVFTIDSVPDRVVVLEFSFVDALANIGVSPVGVADDGDANNLIDAISSKVNPWTSVGSRYQPSLEVIASLKPDLIIADPDRNASIYEDLKKIAPTVVLKSRGETYQDNLDTFVKIGTIMGQEAAVKARLEEHHQRMDKLAGQISSNFRFQFAVANERGLWMHGPKSYAGSVMERLGLRVATAEERETAYIATTLEQLLNANPDVFLLGEYGETTIVDTWKTNPLWSLMSATKSDRFYEADPRLWSLNRGMIAAELMAEELVELINKP
jgi:iron complex transport system substrate-binding protein